MTPLGWPLCPLLPWAVCGCHRAAQKGTHLSLACLSWGPAPQDQCGQVRQSAQGLLPSRSAVTLAWWPPSPATWVLPVNVRRPPLWQKWGPESLPGRLVRWIHFSGSSAGPRAALPSQRAGPAGIFYARKDFLDRRPAHQHTEAKRPLLVSGDLGKSRRARGDHTAQAGRPRAHTNPHAVARGQPCTTARRWASPPPRGALGALAPPCPQGDSDSGPCLSSAASVLPAATKDPSSGKTTRRSLTACPRPCPLATAPRAQCPLPPCH